MNLTTQTREPSNQEVRKFENTRQMLTSPVAADRLAMVAASHMNPQRMLRVVAVAAMRVPKLYDVHPISMLGALMSAASLGLEPNSPLGHCFLIPFENRKKKRMDVELVLGYKGMIQLAMNSGKISSIRANIHYSDDEFWEWEEGSKSYLRHRPGPQMGEKLHAYAAAEGPNGFSAWMAYPWQRIIKIRDNSANWKSAVQFGTTKNTPWFTAEDAMGRKTMVRALFNMLPKSAEMLTGMDLDGGKNHDFGSLALNPEMAKSGEYLLPNDEDMDDGRFIEHEDEVQAEVAPEPAKEEQKAPARQKPAPRATKAAAAKPAEPEPQKEQVVDTAEAETESLDDDLVEDGEFESAAGAEDQHPLYQEAKGYIHSSGLSAKSIRTGLAARLDQLKKSDPNVWTAIDKMLSDHAASDDE